MDDDISTGQLVNRAARLLRRLADQRLASLGLAASYLPVLDALMGGAALSQKALTERAGIEQPTMAATLSRMERDGIVLRRSDPTDRRSSLFALTPDALGRAGAIRSAIARLNDDALAGMGADDRSRLRGLLRVMSATIERALGDP